MTRERAAWIAGAGLVALGAVSIGIGARNAVRPEQSQDLAPVFRAARLWLVGANPYVPIDVDAWRAATHAEDIPDIPAGPDASTIYSPIAVMDVAATSGASWLTTKRVWLALNLALAGYVPWLIWRLWYRHWPAALTCLAAGMWMGGMGLRIGLGNGQHALVWLSFTLSACALASSWPRTSGVMLAWSLHKFNLTAIMAPYFVAKRAVVALVAAAVACGAAIAVFLVLGHVPAGEIVASYAREFSWLFGQSHGGTLPGRGLTDLYSLFAALLGAGRIASGASFAFAAGGVVVTFLATRGANRLPRDIEIAAWLLLVLWTTYHRAYDTVLLAIPLAVVIDRAWRSTEAVQLWRVTGLVAALTVMWYVDPSKVYRFVYPTALDRLPDSGGLVVLETMYRAGVLAVWAYSVAAAARERAVDPHALAVQASPIGSDKTAGMAQGVIA